MIYPALKYMQQGSVLQHVALISMMNCLICCGSTQSVTVYYHIFMCNVWISRSIYLDLHIDYNCSWRNVASICKNSCPHHFVTFKLFSEYDHFDNSVIYKPLQFNTYLRSFSICSFCKSFFQAFSFIFDWNSDQDARLQRSNTSAVSTKLHRWTHTAWLALIDQILPR